MKRITLTLGLLLLLCACGQERPNTQILARIDADPGVRGSTATLRVIVYGPPYDESGLPITVLRNTPFDMQSYEWPIVVALAPEGRDPTRRYRIEAIAEDADTQSVATVRAISGYVVDQTLTLPLRLLDRCIGVTCEDPGQTCFGPDDCRDATIDPSTLLDGGASDMDAGIERCVEGGCDDGYDCTVDTCGSSGQCVHVAVHSSCDDDNACTDDSCTATGEDGCSHVANTISCDDGVYCNGIDRCASGACVSPGNPCLGATVCSEEMNACTGCATSTDCPSGEQTLGACGYPSSCSETGTQARTTISYACNASSICVETRVEDTAPCGTRETTGDFCNDSDPCTDMEMCTAGGTCGGGIPICAIDAGVMDAGQDAGRDSGIDAGRDSGIDAGFDAGRDSGSEGGLPDSSTPVPAEAGMTGMLEASVPVP